MNWYKIAQQEQFMKKMEELAKKSGDEIIMSFIENMDIAPESSLISIFNRANKINNPMLAGLSNQLFYQLFNTNIISAIQEESKSLDQALRRW